MTYYENVAWAERGALEGPSFRGLKSTLYSFGAKNTVPKIFAARVLAGLAAYYTGDITSVFAWDMADFYPDLDFPPPSATEQGNCSCITEDQYQIILSKIEAINETLNDYLGIGGNKVVNPHVESGIDKILKDINGTPQENHGWNPGDAPPETPDPNLHVKIGIPTLEEINASESDPEKIKASLSPEQIDAAFKQFLNSSQVPSSYEVYEDSGIYVPQT